LQDIILVFSQKEKTMSERSRFTDDREDIVKPSEFDRRKKRGHRLTNLWMEYTIGNIEAAEQELLSVSIQPHCNPWHVVSLGLPTPIPNIFV
jgi:hypothetical protein